MKLKNSLILIGIFISFMAGPTVRAEDQSLPKARLSSVGDLSTTFSNDSFHALLQAGYNKHLEKDFTGSADAILSAAEMLKSVDGPALSPSASELVKLAQRVRSGGISTVKQIEPVFARVNLTLSDFYRTRSSEILAANDFSRVGSALENAVLAVENAREWKHIDFNIQAESALSKAHELATSMKENSRLPSGKSADDVAAAIEGVGKVARNLAG